ncbi:putative Zinc finger, MYND-type [Helianthus annuus]|nr:putative Zinc finger, MYND-type [Helianthus annuus]
MNKYCVYLKYKTYFALLNVILASPLCSWCGTWKGDKVCSNCKRARYCSKTHQAIHWSSTHKTQCRTIDLMLQPSNSAPANSSDDIPKG